MGNMGILCGYKDIEQMNIMSVVKFKVKERYEDDFIEAYRKAGSETANFWHLVKVDENIFFSINELPGVEEVLEREDVGVPWLDTVEHMLELFGESRTEAFSGLIIEEYNNPNWQPTPGQSSA